MPLKPLKYGKGPGLPIRLALMNCGHRKTSPTQRRWKECKK